MENTYIYGGFIQTGGKLQDGTPWGGHQHYDCPARRR